MTAMKPAKAAPAARPAFSAVPAPLDTSVFVRPIAHRGLHDFAKGRIENTAPAFLAAIARGYGIECDLQPAADGTPMVFHDDRLDRLIEGSGRVDARSPADLRRLRYKNQDTHILSFADFLELVDGRVPMLVEVKKCAQSPPDRFLDLIARQARAYRGPIALMSFNRAFVAALAVLAPWVPRGPVVGSHRLPATWWAAPGQSAKAAIAGRTLSLASKDASFCAVDVKMLQSAAIWRSHRAERLALFSWTIRTPKERLFAARWADAPIFEGYEA